MAAARVDAAPLIEQGFEIVTTGTGATDTAV